MNELSVQVPLSTCLIYVGTWLQAATRPESTGFNDDCGLIAQW